MAHVKYLLIQLLLVFWIHSITSINRLNKKTNRVSLRPTSGDEWNFSDDSNWSFNNRKRKVSSKRRVLPHIRDPNLANRRYYAPPKVNEIHIEMDNPSDLSGRLHNNIGFNPIETPVKSKTRLKNGSNSVSSSKPFWGPPIIPTVSTRPNHYKSHHSTTNQPLVNIPRPKTQQADVSKGIKKSNNHKLPGPIHPWPLFDNVQQTKNDPFDVSFWNRPTEWTRISPITTEKPHPDQLSGSVDSKTLNKLIPALNNAIESLIAAPATIATHPPYHKPADYPTPAASVLNYAAPHQPSSLMQVDFSPLFLALIPLALVLGAAASFGLASAVKSNTAVASAQQQQQQESTNNNNANNNNAMLSLLAALGGSYRNPYYIIVNGTQAISARNSIMKKKRKRT